MTSDDLQSFLTDLYERGFCVRFDKDDAYLVHDYLPAKCNEAAIIKSHSIQIRALFNVWTPYDRSCPYWDQPMLGGARRVFEKYWRSIDDRSKESFKVEVENMREMTHYSIGNCIAKVYMIRKDREKK